MQIELTKFLNSISFALDYVENEFLKTLIENYKKYGEYADPDGVKSQMLLQIAPFHSKRVAVLANRIATAMNLDFNMVYAITHTALLHDCALAEYMDLYTPKSDSTERIDMKPHCIAGEKIVSGLVFYDDIQSTVLYHHEQADGKGPFGKCGNEIPLGAQIIHIADDLDIRFTLNQMDEDKYEKIRAFVAEQKEKLYSTECVDAFLSGIDYDLLQSINGENSLNVVNQLLPCVKVDISEELLRKMSLIFADITDYKSNFTWRHSMGIAKKAEIMGHYYGYSNEICDKLFIAGALHDIGKLFISNDILEKPGKLTSDEYKAIQNHAAGTWTLLEGIGGMEDITAWAANHHEKLDGTGYPYKKTAADLTINDRLMACLDIYQALVEERPYKAGLSHTEAMAILNKMGDAGQLDAEIIKQIGQCFADTSSGESGSTAGAASDDAVSTAGAASVDSVSADGQTTATRITTTQITADQTEAAEIKETTYTGEAWKCPVCGYIYEGALPEDFICPRCEQPGSIFEKI